MSSEKTNAEKQVAVTITLAQREPFKGFSQENLSRNNFYWPVGTFTFHFTWKEMGFCIEKEPRTE